MKKLKDFKNFHKNKDIYILASGKSVDYIDKAFFNGKIVIGINQAYKKTECQYLLRKESELIEDVVTKNQNSIIFISRGKGGGAGDINNQIINKLDKKITKNIVVYEHDPNRYWIPLSNLPSKNKLVVSYSTITTGIHLAAYMGAKNIILIGHDCGTINGECNFKDYHTKETYAFAWKEKGVEGYKNWLGQIEKDTITLKKILKKEYNCNVYSLNPFINFGLEGNKYVNNNVR